MAWARPQQPHLARCLWACGLGLAWDAHPARPRQQSSDDGQRLAAPLPGQGHCVGPPAIALYLGKRLDLRRSHRAGLQGTARVPGDGPGQPPHVLNPSRGPHAARPPAPAPTPSVSKTSLHRPWSWTSFLLSSAAASWASPRRSHPRPSPAETRPLRPRAAPQALPARTGPCPGCLGRWPWRVLGGPTGDCAAAGGQEKLGAGAPKLASPPGSRVALRPAPVAPGYLPLHGVVTGLLLGGEALVLLLGVVICGTSRWKGGASGFRPVSRQ